MMFTIAEPSGAPERNWRSDFFLKSMSLAPIPPGDLGRSLCEFLRFETLLGD
jgi:hypothetical protein